MATDLVTRKAWNCHMHCFDPAKHPFKPSRTYTPQPAHLESLVSVSLTDNIVIVQATIEDGYDGLLEALRQFRVQWPDKIARGVVLLDGSATKPPLEELGHEAFIELHNLGVRSVRIHGAFDSAGSDASWVIEQFRKAAQLPGVKEHGWSISAQLPLATWASITNTLLTDPQLSACTIMLDHNGSATPEAEGTESFAAILRLLESGRAYIKIGALHRRSPGDINRMMSVIKTIAATAPYALVWGSDWPHCNSRAKGLEPAPPLAGVDTNAELDCLRSWLTDEQWTAMMVDNPARAFP